MAKTAVPSLLRYLRQTCADAVLEADAELLRQFIETNDHRAFEVLLARHGPMVLGTARRLVHNSADADDVFQAVFLSLVRLAKSIREGQSLANWLYTTTCRIAARARRRRRAQALDRAPEPSIASTVAEDLGWREVCAAIDEELQRLPERLRSPLLLCYLSGLTRDEAAEQLGWSLGTLKRRLEQGRALLRKRLERRDISGADPTLAVLAPTALHATVPPRLAQSCLDAVFRSQVSAGASALVAGSMTFKGLAMKAVLVTLTLVGLGVGLYAAFDHAGRPGPVEPSQPEEPNATARRVDSLGDPLPDGAVMRLGTRRFRAQHFPWRTHLVYLQTAADGRSYLGLQGSEIRRMDLKSGVLVESWSIPKSVGALAWAGQPDQVPGFSADGRWVLFTNDYIRHGLVDVAQDWHLTLFDLTARKRIWSVSKKLEAKDWPNLATCVFAADNRWFVSASRNGNQVCLWDARSGKQVWKYHPKGQSLSPIGFVDGGQTVVLRDGNDGAVYLLDRARGTVKKSFLTVGPQCWGQVVLSPDGKYLIICNSQPPSVWDLSGKKVAVLAGQTTWANAAAFSPDGKKLYTGGYDTFVIERQWPLGQPIRKIHLGQNRVQRLAVTPDGHRLQVAFEGEQALVFCDLQTGKQLSAPIAGHRGTVYGVDCAPGGSLVSFASDRSVRSWDLKRGTCIAQFPVELDLNGRSLALSADGMLVAVPNYDARSIGIYERRTGKRQRDIEVGSFWSQRLAFSPAGRFLAGTDGSQRTAKVWDLTTGKDRLHVRAINSCNSVAGAFSPDGRTFAFGDGGTVRMWDTATWKEARGLQVIAPLGLSSSGLAYSPDGRMIATVSDYGDGVRFYEVATRGQRAHIQIPGSTTGILCFSHDGRLLAWVNDRKKIYVLDVRTGALAGPFTGHDDAITGLTFTIDDRSLASSSGDCTILVWDVSSKLILSSVPECHADADWQALKGENAETALIAMRALAASPATALKLAREHFKAAEPVDPQWVAARLRGLDNRRFAERERATRELEDRGDRVAPALVNFLAGTPSLEARTRAARILEDVRGRPAAGQAAQFLRALEVLEWIGTAQARKLVEILAQGAEGVSFTEAAKSSLERWKVPRGARTRGRR